MLIDSSPAPELVLVREHVLDILLGPVFLFVGVGACIVAALRRRAGSRLLTWFGLFIGLYGLRMLAAVSSALHIVPASPWPFRLIIAVDYVLVIPAFLFWFELSLGGFRRVLRWLIYLSSTVAVAGLIWFAISGSPYEILRINQLLAILCMVLLAAMVMIPRIAKKYLEIRSTAVRIAMPLIALVTVYVNVMWFFGTPRRHTLNPLRSPCGFRP